MKRDTRLDTPAVPLVQAVSEALESYSSHPIQRLWGMHLIRQFLDEQEGLVVADARDVGHTWQDIADALGTNRQAVADRYGLSSGRERIRRGERQRCHVCGFESRLEDLFEDGVCTGCRKETESAPEESSNRKGRR
jgi:hypothetical protein